MGLSTHVLDTMHGRAAAGMAVTLLRTHGLAATPLLACRLDADGRPPQGLLLEAAALEVGTYRLVFDVAGYFRDAGVLLPQPNFLDQVSLDFGVAQPQAHYHVPLLVSPWGYTTYRGS